METEASVSPALERNPHLDALRGVAVCGVLAWHFVVPAMSATPGSLSSYLARPFALGWLGVDLFFVISGYLIGSIIIKSVNATNFRTVFFFRRACRVLPVYLLLLCLYGWCSRTEPDNSSVPFWSFWVFLQNLFMAWHQDFGPGQLNVTWSLAVEEQFYLLAAVCLPSLTPRAIRVCAVCGAVGAVLLRLTAFASSEPIISYVLLPTRADALGGGVVLSTLLPFYESSAIAQRRVLAARIARFVILPALLVVGLMVFPRYGFWSQYASFVGYFGAAVGAVALVGLASVSHPVLGSRSSRIVKCLRWIGERAYSLYLLHPVVGQLFSQAFEVDRLWPLAWVPCAIGASLLVAHASFVWIEQPFMRLGRRMTYRVKLVGTSFASEKDEARE